VPLLTIATASVIAIAVQALWIPLDADVSWLITVCERVLSGDRLYVDIMEVNPPASVWLYLPFVAAAKLAGLRPEAVVAGAFAAAGIASSIATLRLAARLNDATRPSWLAVALSFVALVLPMALFAQREHAALLLALPALTCMALVAEGRRLPPTLLLSCGFAAGLIVDIKPYFVAAVLPPLAWAIWKRGSAKPFLGAIAAGAAAVILYAGAILAFAPVYLERVPIIAETYGPMHDALWKVIVGPAFYPTICIALAALLKPRRIPSLAWVWGLGAAGFYVAAVAQAKNYPNHWLPQAGLALGAAAAVAGAAGIHNTRRALVAIALASVGLCEMYHWIILPDPKIEAAVRQVAPPAPRIIALSPQLTTGHPVTRNVGGTWVGSRAGLFTASGALYVGMKDPKVAAAYSEDIDSFAADVAKNDPDIVLVSIPAKHWLMREPVIARTMSGYRPAAVAGDTEVWVRRNLRG
jgi:hypothetical protein